MSRAPRRGIIRPGGRRWIVELDGRRVQVPNRVGLRYLSELLPRPGQSIPALTLASNGIGHRAESLHELLDDEARTAYAARVRELTGVLAEAEADNDLARAERLRLELDALVDELESATGLGGRPRTFTDPTERARSSVSKAISRAINAIDDASPAIADELRATVSCGVVCSYAPDPRAPVVWSTSLVGAGDTAQLTESLAAVDPMAREVLWHVTMSLDGFIAGPDGSMAWAGRSAEGGPLVAEVSAATGAVLAGRGGYDLGLQAGAGRAVIGGAAWSGPLFVLTHRSPGLAAPPGVTFLAGSIEDAVATARAAADGKGLAVVGASIARQCLERGLLDGIVVRLEPVMLGEGVRLYDARGAGDVRLERIGLWDRGPVTGLRFRVLR